jgi:hypothetical protein
MEKEINLWYEKSFIKLNKAFLKTNKSIRQINVELNQHYKQTYYEMKRIKNHQKTIQVKTIEKYLKYFNLEA